jgi:hypothetical protein
LKKSIRIFIFEEKSNFMKALLSACIFLISVYFSAAQRVHVGIAGGVANYSGDLPDKFYINSETKGFFGATVHYELSNQLFLRAGFSFASVSGNDKFSSKSSLQKRNLSFETAISEFSVVGEFYPLNINEERLSPYVFGGLAIFQFNPYTYDAANRQVFLRPLSTEGQGIYPGKKKYSLNQEAIPFGGGLKVLISENLMLGIEIGFRKLFTDYLDDVSTTYADYNDLLAAKGSVAVELAYREDELQGGNPIYPTKGTQRGNSVNKDMYYFTGLNLSLRLGNGSGRKYKFSGKKSKYGCPSVPM